MAVDANLDRQREPRLQPNVHQAEIRIKEVEVQAEATPPRIDQVWLALPIGDLEAGAGLQRAEHADQSFGHPIFFGNPAGLGVLVAIANPGKRASLLLRKGFSMVPDALGMTVDEGFEVLDQQAVPVQEPLHRVRPAGRQIPLEHHTVETSKRSSDQVAILVDELLHGVLLGLAVSPNPAMIKEQRRFFIPPMRGEDWFLFSILFRKRDVDASWASA